MKLLKKFKVKNPAALHWAPSSCNAGFVWLEYPNTFYTDTFYNISKLDAEKAAVDAKIPFVLS